jgi:hypothetical protein
MPSKQLLFEFKAKSATFRVADTDPPLEEVTVVGKGRFRGKPLTSLYTTRITPTGKSRDREDGAGILYLEGGGRAAYRISGSVGSTDRWREMAEGTVTFGNHCSGSLSWLKNSRASYETLVNSKGESKTRVWKNRPLRRRD